MTARVALLLGGAALGFVCAVAAVLLHQSWTWLLVALLAALATMRALGPGAARVGFAVAWLVVVMRTTLPTPAGDVLVSDNPHGWTLLLGSLVIVVAALASVRPAVPADGVAGERPTPT